MACRLYTKVTTLSVTCCATRKIKCHRMSSLGSIGFPARIAHRSTSGKRAEKSKLGWKNTRMLSTNGKRVNLAWQHIQPTLIMRLIGEVQNLWKMSGRSLSWMRGSQCASLIRPSHWWTKTTLRSLHVYLTWRSWEFSRFSQLIYSLSLDEYVTTYELRSIKCNQSDIAPSMGGIAPETGRQTR